MTFQPWLYNGAPVEITDKVTNGKTTMAQYQLRQQSIDPDIHRVIHDPCRFIHEDAVKCAMEQETEAQRKARSAAIREKRDYRRQAWAAKSGIPT